MMVWTWLRVYHFLIKGCKKAIKNKKTFTQKSTNGRVFAYGEDTHTLRPESELPDLRARYVNRYSFASRCE